MNSKINVRKAGIVSLVFLGMLLVFLAGCAKQKEKVRVIWPPPPGEPKIEWIGNYRNQDDLLSEAAKVSLQAIIGERKSIALTGPISLASDSDGRLLVSDIWSKSIIGMDFQKREMFPPLKEMIFKSNLGLAIDRQKRLYVADGQANKIFVFSAEGKPLFVIDGGQEINGGKLFQKPAYLAVNQDLQRLYVSDSVGSEIVVFDLQGAFLFRFGGRGGDPGRFHAPQGLAIDRAGNVFVADFYNSRVQAFTADGKFLHAFGKRGTGKNDFEALKGVAFDPDGNLYVVDTRRPGFRVFTPEGRLLLDATMPISPVRAFTIFSPASISIDELGRIYIGDLVGRQVSVWQYLTPEYLKNKPL